MCTHGVLTSVRLGNMVCDILAELAAAEGRTTNALIALFPDEILAHRSEVPNFASFLRVTCMRHLRRVSASARRDAPGQPGPPRLAAVVPLVVPVATGR